MITERWEYHPEWLEYVLSNHKGGGRVELVSDESAERRAFHDTAKEAFARNGVPASHVKTYLSIQKPEEGEGYAKQYPHIHYPLNGTTLVHYLQPGDKPAPLDIFEDGKVVETIYPEIGLTVFMPNDVMHGVRKNNGTTNRIQLIATALR